MLYLILKKCQTLAISYCIDNYHQKIIVSNININNKNKKKKNNQKIGRNNNNNSQICVYSHYNRNCLPHLEIYTHLCKTN